MIVVVYVLTYVYVCLRPGKPRGRQPKQSKHSVDSGGVINISDDSSSDSDGMDTDSNSSPDSLLDNDDVIFVNHTSYTAGSRALNVPFVCPDVKRSRLGTSPRSDATLRRVVIAAKNKRGLLSRRV